MRASSFELGGGLAALCLALLGLSLAGLRPARARWRIAPALLVAVVINGGLCVTALVAASSVMTLPQPARALRSKVAGRM